MTGPGQPRKVKRSTCVLYVRHAVALWLLPDPVLQFFAAACKSLSIKQHASVWSGSFIYDVLL